MCLLYCFLLMLPGWDSARLWTEKVNETTLQFPRLTDRRVEKKQSKAGPEGNIWSYTLSAASC